MGFGADTLGYGEGALEEGFEVGLNGTDFAGDGVRLFDLAEDLGLAEDHGVERGGDAEEVADGFSFAEFVEVGLEGGGGDAEVLVKEAREIGGGVVIGGGGVFLKGEDLDAVAGGEDEAFADTWLMDEGAGGVGETPGGDGEALPHIEWRGVVVDAEEDEFMARSGAVVIAHGAVNLWTEESWLAAQTVRMTRKMKLER